MGGMMNYTQFKAAFLPFTTESSSKQWKGFRAKNISDWMDAAFQHLPSSSQRSTVSLKLNTACEDWVNCQARDSKKYGYPAFYAIRLGVSLHYNVREILPPHSYQVLCSISYCVIGLPHSGSALTYQIILFDFSAAFITANHNVLLETILFSWLLKYHAHLVLYHFSVASPFSPPQCYFHGLPSLLYPHSSPTWSYLVSRNYYLN